MKTAKERIEFDIKLATHQLKNAVIEQKRGAIKTKGSAERIARMRNESNVAVRELENEIAKLKADLVKLIARQTKRAANMSPKRKQEIATRKVFREMLQPIKYHNIRDTALYDVKGYFLRHCEAGTEGTMEDVINILKMKVECDIDKFKRMVDNLFEGLAKNKRFELITDANGLSLEFVIRSFNKQISVAKYLLTEAYNKFDLRDELAPLSYVAKIKMMRGE